MMRNYRFLGFKNRVKHGFLASFFLCGALLLPVLAMAQVTVGELTQISSTRVSRVAIEFTYRVEFINTAGAVENVSATVTSSGASTTITEGALTFPDMAAGSTVSSTDTFTIRQDRRFPFDPDALVFNIQSTPVSDITPPQISIVLPASGALVIESRPAIEVQATDDIQLVTASLALTANGQPLAADCLFTGDTAQCSPTVDLPEGAVVLIASVDDAAGNTGSIQADFVVDSQPLALSISAPVNNFITTASSIQVTGTVSAGVSAVQVNGVAATIGGGGFSATVPLREGRNMLVAVGTRASGRTGTASVDVTRDIVAPIVSIDLPSDGFVSVNDKVAVTGKVNDIVSGGTNARVLVNGIEATVAGGSYMITDIALVRGSNTITAVATDSVGNQGSRSISVTFQRPVGARMTELSGNGQAGLVNTALAQPLVAVVKDDLGNPVAGRVVRFEVTRNSGGLKAGSGDAPQRIVQVPTDGSGRATLLFALGDTAGEGNNRVKASAVGVAGEVEFCASGLGESPQKILMVNGDNQRGVVGFPLANPMQALVVDKDGNPSAGVDVTFSVDKGTGNLDGQQSLIRTTGSDGIARAVLTLGLDPGINNNVVNAAFAGLAGLSASFTSSGLAPGNPAETKFRGVVLDNGHNPIPGAIISIPDSSVVNVTTDDEGQFMLENVPVGHIQLHIDPANSPRSETFPDLSFETVTVAGQINILGQPILLPTIQTESSKLVGGNADVTVKMPGVAGLELTVFANSVTCPDGSSQCQVTISQVHLDKVPMPPPSGTLFMPPAWTIQPAGTLFDPPAKISIPNDGLPPGRVIDIFQFDHTLNEFINVGKGTVSDDAFVIVSDPGFGITRAGWGGCGQPQPPTTCTPACPAMTMDDCTATTYTLIVNDPATCDFTCVPNVTNKPNGTACTDDGMACTDDICMASMCEHPLRGMACPANTATPITDTHTSTTLAASMSGPTDTSPQRPTFTGTACIDQAADAWTYRVSNLTAAGAIRITPTPAANTPNPVVGASGNINAGNFCSAILDLADYTSTRTKGPNWHVTQASIDHEDYHWNTDWITDSVTANWTGASGESLMESRTLSCAAANTQAAANSSLQPTVTADFNTAVSAMIVHWNSIAPDSSAGHLAAYQAGQIQLTPVITNIVTFAQGQSFCNDNNPCTTDIANQTGPTCCANTNLPNGTACGVGMMCTSGVCGP